MKGLCKQSGFMGLHPGATVLTSIVAVKVPFCPASSPERPKRPGDAARNAGIFRIAPIAVLWRFMFKHIFVLYYNSAPVWESFSFFWGLR